MTLFRYLAVVYFASFLLFLHFSLSLLLSCLVPSAGFFLIVKDSPTKLSKSFLHNFQLEGWIFWISVRRYTFWTELFFPFLNLCNFFVDLRTSQFLLSFSFSFRKLMFLSKVSCDRLCMPFGKGYERLSPCLLVKMIRWKTSLNESHSNKDFLYKKVLFDDIFMYNSLTWNLTMKRIKIINLLVAIFTVKKSTITRFLHRTILAYTQKIIIMA